jgi:hypothetical protein
MRQAQNPEGQFRYAKLRILRAVFNLGIKRGYLTLNPVARLDFAELETKEVEVFSVEQTTSFLNATLEMDPKLGRVLCVRLAG